MLRNIARFLALTLLLSGSGQAMAGPMSGGPLNYDPALPVPAPVLDAGWTSDAIFAANMDSADSPYVFNLTSPAFFRITDAFIVGDTYTVFDSGNPILTTSFQAFGAGFGDDPTADAAWTSAAFGSGEILLSPGNYSLTVQGDGAGGIPAGFFTRLDSAPVVPEPATMTIFALGAIGMAGAAIRRRRKTA